MPSSTSGGGLFRRFPWTRVLRTVPTGVFYHIRRTRRSQFYHIRRTTRLRSTLLEASRTWTTSPASVLPPAIAALLPATWYVFYTCRDLVVFYRARCAAPTQARNSTGLDLKRVLPKRSQRDVEHTILCSTMYLNFGAPEPAPIKRPGEVSISTRPLGDTTRHLFNSFHLLHTCRTSNKRTRYLQSPFQGILHE